MLRALFLGLMTPVFSMVPLFVVPLFLSLCFLVEGKGWLMFLTWADHVQACAADFNLSLEDVQGLLAGSWVVRRLCHRVRDGLNLV